MSQRLNPTGRLVLLSLGLLTFLLLFDYLIATRPVGRREEWAIIDNVVHAMTAFLVILPLVWRGYSWKLPIVAYLLASLNDIDHFIMAGTMSISDAITVPKILPTHSLTFAVPVGFLVWGVTRNRLWGWVTLAALGTHVLRDAAGRPINLFYPMDRIGVPYVVYLGLTVGCLWISSNWAVSDQADRSSIA